jgi:uncharacterized membrane protein HdeD (DUF308 family)
MDETTRGAGWLMFAGIVVLIAGVLNVIWGFAAIDGANFFLEDERYVIGDLNTMGWTMLVIGIVQLIAAFSIWAGGEFGRWIGVIGATIGAIGALLSIPGYPLWAVCVFGIQFLVLYGLLAHGGHQSRA